MKKKSTGFADGDTLLSEQRQFGRGQLRAICFSHSNRPLPMLVASEELSDDRLLNDYVLSCNQDSFAVLVRRYGPLVWGVCRRTAGHTHDAEDAFQATFAILARKAASIRRRRSIGAWLQQV